MKGLRKHKQPVAKIVNQRIVAFANLAELAGFIGGLAQIVRCLQFSLRLMPELTVATFGPARLLPKLVCARIWWVGYSMLLPPLSFEFFPHGGS